jgi:hypothetical protein
MYNDEDKMIEFASGMDPLFWLSSLAITDLYKRTVKDTTGASKFTIKVPKLDIVGEWDKTAMSAVTFYSHKGMMIADDSAYDMSLMTFSDLQHAAVLANNTILDGVWTGSGGAIKLLTSIARTAMNDDGIVSLGKLLGGTAQQGAKALNVCSQPKAHQLAQYTVKDGTLVTNKHYNTNLAIACVLRSIARTSAEANMRSRIATMAINKILAVDRATKKSYDKDILTKMLGLMNLGGGNFNTINELYQDLGDGILPEVRGMKAQRFFSMR